MSISGHLISHWGKHKESQALWHIKDGMQSLRNLIVTKVEHAEASLADDALEDLPEEMVTEIEEIMTIYASCSTALAAHSEFLDWSPPNES